MATPIKSAVSDFKKRKYFVKLAAKKV